MSKESEEKKRENSFNARWQTLKRKMSELETTAGAKVSAEVIALEGTKRMRYPEGTKGPKMLGARPFSLTDRDKTIQRPITFDTPVIDALIDSNFTTPPQDAMCDYIIYLKHTKKELHVHKQVLMIHSPVLRAAMLGKMKEAVNNRYELETDERDFICMLTAMYSAKKMHMMDSVELWGVYKQSHCYECVSLQCLAYWELVRNAKCLDDEPNLPLFSEMLQFDPEMTYMVMRQHLKTYGEERIRWLGEACRETPTLLVDLYAHTMDSYLAEHTLIPNKKMMQLRKYVEALGFALWEYDGETMRCAAEELLLEIAPIIHLDVQCGNETGKHLPRSHAERELDRLMEFDGDFGDKNHKDECFNWYSIKHLHDAVVDRVKDARKKNTSPDVVEE